MSMFNPEIHPANFDIDFQEGILEAAQRTDWNQYPITITRDARQGLEELTNRAGRAGLLMGEYVFRASALMYPLTVGSRQEIEVRLEEDDYFGEFRGYDLAVEEGDKIPEFEAVKELYFWRSFSPIYVPRLALKMDNVMLLRKNNDADTEQGSLVNHAQVMSYRIASMTRVLS